MTTTAEVPGKCTIAGCDRPHKARGWCFMHYKRWLKHGDPEAVDPNHPSLEKRFWGKVDRPEHGCWEWQASFKTSGYGQFMVTPGRPTPSHRMAWELSHGPIPEGMLVCHHCDNRKCVRPDHLFLGTHLDNMRDMHAKGRGGAKRRYGLMCGVEGCPNQRGAGWACHGHVARLRRLGDVVADVPLSRRNRPGVVSARRP